jgi:prepilin-type N-terminal cleavage/methylation domain-containing protein/prepilin-type processing-associated H-X9-DG protein
MVKMVNMKEAHTTHAPCRSNGFTFVELLVVMAIIAVLAALMLPAMSATRVNQQALTCLSHYNQLMKACVMYTGDYHDFYPPNPDDGGTTPGYEWVSGDVEGWMPEIEAGGNAEAGNLTYLTSPAYSVLAPYILAPHTNGNAAVFKCPTDPRICAYQGKHVPVVRSCSCNGGVGTVDPGFLNSGGGSHSGIPTIPAPGPWLTGSHEEFQSQYATFGKASAFKICSPAEIFVYDDESPWSINDGCFVLSARVSEVVDWPTFMHQGAGVFSFADGHAEIHKWKSNLFALDTPANFAAVPANSPGYQDWYWLAWHATRSSVTGTVP